MVHGQLIFFGTVVSVFVALFLGVFSAVRQYSIGDYTFTTLAFIGIAMPPFWFGLLAQQFLAVGPKEWFHLQQPIFYFVGLHTPGQTGFNLDYARHLVLPVLTLTVQIDRVVEPVPTHVDARRPVERLHPHRARQGRAATAGDRQARDCATR